MRHRFLTLPALTILAVASLATGAGAAEKKPPPPNSNADSVDLLLGLVREQGSLRRHVRKIADPGSASYRKHLSIQQIQYRYGANSQTRAAVRNYFERRGLRVKFDATGAVATVRMSLARAQRMFDTRVVARASNGRTVRSTTHEPSPPAALRPFVNEVAGLDTTAAPQPQAKVLPPARSSALNLPKRSGTPSGCAAGLASGAFTPNQMVTAHGYDGLHKRGIKGQGRKVALLEFGGGFKQSDLDTWAACFGRKANNVRALPVGIAAPYSTDAEASLEVALDIQVLLGMAPELRRIDVYEGGPDANFSTLISAALDSRVSGSKQLPDVISISYGTCEPAVVDGGMPDLRLTRYMLLAAAAAGVPVVISSGDNGSSGCYRQDPAVTQPFTSYPSTLSYATAVGGTSWRLKDDNTIADERVWNDIIWGVEPAKAGGGGGGKSLLNSRPYYQPKTKAKGSGARLVPDVSFYADEAPGWAVYCTGTINDCGKINGYHAVGGTSAAAPALAAGVALTNQYAAKRGVPKIGFLNPLIYELGGPKSDAIRDIHLGTNDIFGVKCCVAKRGFDEASGWGSPRIHKFAQAATEAWQDSPAGD